MDFPQMFLWYGAFVLSATFHEAAHAFAALKLGDRTAYLGGQVTLNPLPHMRREPFGMIFVPVLVSILSGGSYAFGWASAPYDPQWAYQYPRRSALMALAGPLANLIIVIAAGAVMVVGSRAGWWPAAEGSMLTALLRVLEVLYFLNVLLFVFNLLPVPPLDGATVIHLFMSVRTARRWSDWVHGGHLGFLGILVALCVMQVVLPPVIRLAHYALEVLSTL